MLRSSGSIASTGFVRSAVVMGTPFPARITAALHLRPVFVFCQTVELLAHVEVEVLRVEVLNDAQVEDISELGIEAFVRPAADAQPGRVSRDLVVLLPATAAAVEPARFLAA